MNLARKEIEQNMNSQFYYLIVLLR
jgi:hypothetical protein